MSRLNQHDRQAEQGRAFLQRARRRRAKDQGREERREVDKAFMQELPGQSGKASAFRFGVQSRELPWKACSPLKHQALAAYGIAGEADKDRREGGQYFAVRLPPDG